MKNKTWCKIENVDEIDSPALLLYPTLSFRLLEPDEQSLKAPS